MATAAAEHDPGTASIARQAAAAGIGPNAITRLGAAIDRNHGRDCTRAVFAAAGLERYLDAPPATLVDEREVVRLHAIARAQLGDPAYRRDARLAGNLTGAYLLQNRIPRPIRALLPRLPKALAGRILTRAIERNAWTFVGSGRFYARRVRGRTELVIENSPFAREFTSGQNECTFYASTFERLYRALVDPDLEVRECACLANGASDCRFQILPNRGIPANRR